MGLDTTLRGWLEEIKQAKVQQTQYLKGYRDDLKAFVGTGWREGFGKNQPENHALEWFSLMRAQCLMGNPRVRYTSDTPGKAQVRATAYGYAMSNWTRQTRMRNLNERLLMDWGFRRAVCLVTSAPGPGYVEEEDSPYWPAAFRIAPHHFLHDPASMTPEGWEWTAHLVIGSRKHLLGLAADPASGWDGEVLNKIQGANVKKFRDEDTPIPERDEVPYWEIHASSVELDKNTGGKGGPGKGFHGTTFTVVDDQAIGIGWARPPQAYFGPRSGPHVVSGDFVVPDHAMPLSHVSATKAQSDHLNRISRATIRAIEAYKRIILARNGSNLEEKIKAGRDLFVYSYEDTDLRSALQQLEIGGATEQHFAAKESAQATLDRVSGVTDEMRGETAPDVKATQSAIAAQSAAQRGNFTVGKFRDYIAEIIRRGGYFAARDHDVELGFGSEGDGAFVDPETGEVIEGVQGGLGEGEDPDEYERMGMEIMVGSMDRDLASDSLFRDQVLTQTFQEMAASGPMASLFMDVQSYLDMKAELTGVDEIRRLVSIPKMQMLGVFALTQGQSQGDGAPTTATSSPRPGLSEAPKPAMPAQGSLQQSMTKRAGSPSPSGSKGASKLQKVGS